MKVKNHKIIEATEIELYKLWIERWSDLLAFDEFIRKLKDKGVKIIEEGS